MKKIILLVMLLSATLQAQTPTTVPSKPVANLLRAQAASLNAAADLVDGGVIPSPEPNPNPNPTPNPNPNPTPTPNPAPTGYDMNQTGVLREGFANKIMPSGTPDSGSLTELGIGFAYLPPDNLPRANCAFRWTGAIIPPVTGTYQFHVRMKNGGYLKLDGVPVFDHESFTDTGSHFIWDSEQPGPDNSYPKQPTITKDLVAGKPCAVVAAMYESSPEFIYEVTWKKPGDTDWTNIGLTSLVPPADWQTRIKQYNPAPIPPDPNVFPFPSNYQTPDLPADFQTAHAFEPWSRDVSQLAVDSKSSTYLASLGAFHLHPGFGQGSNGIPIQVLPAGTAMSPVTFVTADESDKGPYPIPAAPVIEDGSDHHWCGYDPASKTLYEIFELRKENGAWVGDSGAIFKLDLGWDQRPDGWTSCDAAGLPIAPGLVRYQELVAGELTHAIRCTVGGTQKHYCRPARHWASSSNSTDLIPMGATLRIKSSVDESSFPPNVQKIIRCGKKYGFIVADNGSPGVLFIIGTPDTRWSDDELAVMKQLHQDVFEVVETGDLFPQ